LSIQKSNDFLILIIKAILNIRTGFKIGKIAKNVEQINEKMDIFLKGKVRRERIKGK